MRIRYSIFKSVIRLNNYIKYFLPALMTNQVRLRYAQEFYDRQAPGWQKAYRDKAELDHWLKQQQIKAKGKKAKALILGAGGGREIRPLLDAGFDVEALESSPQMIKNMQAYLDKNRLQAKIIAGFANKTDYQTNYYQLILACNSFYSIIVGRQQRIAMLKKLRDSLGDNGQLFLAAIISRTPKPSKLARYSRRLLALLTFGYLAIEDKDMFSPAGELVHYFSNQDELTNEFDQAGLKVIWSEQEELNFSYYHAVLMRR